LLRIEGRVTIVGDIHGQFYDFYGSIIKACFKSEQPDCKMLFLGDYVDRGAYGPEIVLLLFALK
jgi:serine/threonine-protein phosphatase 2B catalytic subunit